MYYALMSLISKDPKPQVVVVCKIRANSLRRITMKYGDLKINEVVTLAGLLNGRTGIDGLLADRELDTPKYGEMNLGQNEALVNILGGLENVEAILRGEKKVDLKDAIIKWFDKHGRRIPSRTLQSAVTDADRNYNLTHTKIDLAERLDRLFEYLGGAFITTQDFENRVDQILKGLRNDDNTKLITNGFGFPFALPQTTVGDYGKVLDEVFLPAVERSYKAQFPKRTFYNHRKGTLEGQVSIVDGSRHERLVEAMNQGVVVGVYFPNCLQGFSVDADREQMASLPEKFLLAGGFEACASMIAYPDILARDVNTPLLDLAAMRWRSAGSSLCFRAYDDNLYFDYRVSLGEAGCGCAGGLVVLG